MAKGGWIGVCLPEEIGGAGLGVAEAVVLVMGIAESGAGVAGAQSVHANIYATQVGVVVGGGGREADAYLGRG